MCSMSEEKINQITVLFFANIKELVGVKQVALDLPDGSSVLDLKKSLIHRFPGLEKAIPSVLISVNHEFAFDQDVIPLGAEVALFPPVSGGSADEYPTIISITSEALDQDELLARITLPTTGAACTFTGMVRGVTRLQPGRQPDVPQVTLSLEYEAYVPMAEVKMRQVADEIRTHWPAVQGIALVQRVGHLEPGTPTVIIACTAAHRGTGVFEAARYGIDRLKEIVPVWKKEIGRDGETWIEGKYVPRPED